MLTIRRGEKKATKQMELVELLRNAEEIPTVPESLMQIMRVLDDPDSGPSDLAKVARLDTPLMSKILRVANSPYYANPGSLSDFNRCVAVLGYRTVRQMALGISVVTSLVSAVADTAGRLDYRELWRHSVVVAAMSRRLAMLAGHLDPESVFTAGLLHDIGKFVLEIRSAVIYDHVVALRAETGRPLVEVETEEFGYDHADIGEAFADYWNLPTLMIEVLGGHHSARNGSAAAVVHLADYLANTVIPPKSDLGFDPNHVDPAELARGLGLTMAELDAALPELKSDVVQAGDYLNLV